MLNNDCTRSRQTVNTNPARPNMVSKHTSDRPAGPFQNRFIIYTCTCEGTYDIHIDSIIIVVQYSLYDIIL